MFLDTIRQQLQSTAKAQMPSINLFEVNAERERVRLNDQSIRGSASSFSIKKERVPERQFDIWLSEAPQAP